MATNTEEIITRLGWDARAVTRGTQAMLDGQKKAAMNYVDFWKSAIETRERAEISASERRIAREKATAEIVARNTAESLAKGQAAVAAAQAGIAAGYTPANMAKGAERTAINKWEQLGFEIAGGGASGLAGAYLLKGGKVAGKLNAAGELEKEAENAVKGVHAMGEAAHGNSVALQETGVMIREGLRGAYTRMLGSFSIWLGAMWRPIGRVASAIEKIPVVNKLFGPVSSVLDVATIGTAGIEAYRWRKAVAGQKESQASLHEMVGETSDSLHERVAGLKAAGLISDKEAADYTRQLKRGGFDNVSSVLSATNKYMVGGTADEQLKKLQQQKELTRLDDEHAQKVAELYRVELTGNNAIQNSLYQQHIIREQMSNLDKNSVEYKQKQLEVDALNLDIQKQQRDVAKEKADIEKSIHQKTLEITKITNEINKIDQFTPTIGDLAGRDFSDKLAKAYGRGGKYDLGKVQGPYSGIAQDALLAGYQQQWDVLAGNAVYDKDGKLVGGAAYYDKHRQIADENMLKNAGVETPAMKAAKMQESIDSIKDDISALLKRARTDGIVIADTPAPTG